MKSRTIETQWGGHETSDGAGVRLTRLLTPKHHRRLDPFLMLDAFGSDQPEEYLAGFPDHPHRGFETITYMIEGKMRHRDSAGHEGCLNSGDAQWMFTGRGVIHSELPEQEEGRMAGMQLWLNTPAADKMAAPWYRDIGHSSIRRWLEKGVEVQLLAGHFAGREGAITRPITEPLYVIFHFLEKTVFDIPFSAEKNVFFYGIEGQFSIEEEAVKNGHLVILAQTAEAEGVSIVGEAGSIGLLVAGTPLNEPIVQYGPFVMNTHQEIDQALDDYRKGRF